ncbi:MAG TPA: TetR/AcrR family transcriptional regulator [Pseudonocardia sp.]|jgi:AcrR family transcriptional regulator|nr:TetR/AcrR family transcriptional regulator [Pseudonocardia sp.]
MARPRTHDLDALLDVAEQIVTSTGPSGLTLRQLATQAGVSNGSIYHAFSSKEELLARVWARAAHRMFTAMAERVTATLTEAPTVGESAIDAVVAAALCPVEFAVEHPAAARLFFMQRRDQLLSETLPSSVSDELEAIQSEFTKLLITLAHARWTRRDRVAVDAIATCVVDLPGGLIRRKLLAGDALGDQTRAQIAVACRAILALELPPAHPKTATNDPGQETRP